MEVHVFLATQSWLQVPPCQDPGQPSSKRAKQTHLACKASFHISLEEQYGQQRAQWLGAKAKDAVFIRLQNRSGLFSSALDASIAIQQQDNLGLTIEWYGSTYSVNPSQVVKVVCSPAVYASCLQHCSTAPQQQHISLLAPAAAVADGQDTDYITIVTSHVCLDLFAQHSEQFVEGLSRIAAFLQSHGTSSNTTTSAAAAAAFPANTSTSSSQHQPQCQLQPTAASWAPPADPALLAQWLTGAACEVKMMQMLLDQGPNHAGEQQGSMQAQQGHMLQALGHLHASLKP